MRNLRKFVLANGVAVAMVASAIGMTAPSGATVYPTSAATPAQAALVKYTPQSTLATQTTKQKQASFKKTAATAIQKGIKAIDVYGYTDNKSCKTYAHCVFVSFQHAKGTANALRAQLAAKGSFIPVYAFGRGWNNPIAKNDTAAGRMANNRTVVIYITG